MRAAAYFRAMLYQVGTRYKPGLASNMQISRVCRLETNEANLASDSGVCLVAYLFIRQGLLSTILLFVWLLIFGGVKFYIGAI